MTIQQLHFQSLPNLVSASMEDIMENDISWVSLHPLPQLVAPVR